MKTSLHSALEGIVRDTLVFFCQKPIFFHHRFNCQVMLSLFFLEHGDLTVEGIDFQIPTIAKDSMYYKLRNDKKVELQW